ncbi:hypothetical protein LNKW23_33880 [Paralimibaculum aggregatum]|uniref:Biopolymer transporter ExbD n=1 Tax=Paralimibaculum aggregatum TaxID=3036245 RepID=A0ABQ6LP73_9RHOB|nr:biopolymer transporter ExbD [Limibaculum sp. NKW23]GMG84174.1 hypothetical protein LNKW23_33880 [Limibaculum sp. NKW23]
MPRRGSDAAQPARPRRRLRRRLRIGLTPLIDVVFILLVFFMLASSFEDWRSLPLAAAPAMAGAPAPAMAGAMLVEVAPAGLRLAGAPVSGAALRRRLAERLAAVPEQRVLLRALPGAEMQRLVAAVDLLRAAGVRDLALAPAGGAR